MTQHMQVRVSRADSAEQRQELSHSQALGRARGVAHAAQRHRPQRTQMIDSVVVAEVGEEELGELTEELGEEAFSGLVQGCGACVITVELVGD